MKSDLLLILNDSFSFKLLKGHCQSFSFFQIHLAIQISLDLCAMVKASCESSIFLSYSDLSLVHFIIQYLNFKIPWLFESNKEIFYYRPWRPLWHQPTHHWVYTLLLGSSSDVPLITIVLFNVQPNSHEHFGQTQENRII